MQNTMTRPQKASEGREAQGHGRKSEATREGAMLALLAEKTLASAAKRAGIGERTLRRWLTEDASFAEEYATARRAMFEDGLNRVQSLIGQAVTTLGGLLDAKNHPSVQLGAARTVIEIGLHRHDTEVLLCKVEELETHQRTASSATNHRED